MKFIPIAEPDLNGNELNYVTDCIKAGWISSSGGYITKFENSFAKFCDTNYAIACSSGTTALHLALLALGIKEGDEVIVPDLTFVATANVVMYVGANPIFVDIDSKTWNMDIDLIENRITDKTKAIMVVHLYGNPVDMDRIMKIAKKYNLYVIEDAAEAHGATYKGKVVGSFGDVGCFSFFGNKILTTGEGGMITTNNINLDKSIRILRDHGMTKTKRYWHDVVGYNYRMTNLQGAIGLAQLERLNEFIEKKREINISYRYYLRGLVDFPSSSFEVTNVYWMTTVLLKNKDRDNVIFELQKRGIDSRPVFYPLHALPIYRMDKKFKVSEDVSKRGISLPSSTKLTKEDIQYICNNLIEIIEE